MLHPGHACGYRVAGECPPCGVQKCVLLVFKLLPVGRRTACRRAIDNGASMDGIRWCRRQCKSVSCSSLNFCQSAAEQLVVEPSTTAPAWMAYDGAADNAKGGQFRGIPGSWFNGKHKNFDNVIAGLTQL